MHASLLFDCISADVDKPFDEVFMEVKTRLPWLCDKNFKAGRHEGYKPGNFGSCAGLADNVNAYNLLHEVAHAFEIMESEPLKWKARLALPNFGMRIKSYQTFGGQRYYEPKTMQATIRECRVGGIQKYLQQLAGYDISTFDEEFTRTLVYMSDSYFGGSSILNSHDPAKYTKEEKEWVQTRVDLINKSFNNTSLEKLQNQWVQISAIFEKRAKRVKIEPEDSLTLQW